MEKGDKRVAQRDKKCCREGMCGCHWMRERGTEGSTKRRRDEGRNEETE